MRSAAAPLAVLILLLVAGCGGGGGGGKQLVSSVAETRAYYQVVDLASGGVTSTGSLPGLYTDPAYRTTKMAFRLIQGGTASVGTTSTDWGHDLDQDRRSVDHRPYYIAVFETTRDQWNAMGGTSPWTIPGGTLQSQNTAADVGVGGTLPAVGISLVDATTTLNAFSASRSIRLRLPNEVEWETACRAGSRTSYCWGESLSSTLVNQHALVWETAGNVRGPAEVGSLTANAWGLHDMHGNVWELCSSGVPRGGSWNDPVSLARCANRLREVAGPPVSDTSHLLIGVRLVYVP